MFRLNRIDDARVARIGARLVDERERACDEDVLRSGGEPRVYADAILNVCKLYVESPLTCVAGVTGSDLKRRLRAIFARETQRDVSLPKTILLTLACGLALIVPFVVGMDRSIRAQSPSPTSGAVPQFEVVSIKPNPPFGPPFLHLVGDRWTAPRSKAEQLIEFAYDVDPSQIMGLPPWAQDAFFGIEAKLPANASAKDLPLMVQAMLADRFRLTAHRESRSLKVRTITVAKGGPKLQPAAATCTTDPAEDDKRLLDRRRCGEMVMSAPPVNWRYAVVYQGFSVSMADIAAYLRRWSDTFYVDETGLKGLYDVQVNLDYTPPSDMDERSDDFDAYRHLLFHKGWQEQAGLVLDTLQERAVQVLVVDHLERPTPNSPVAVLK